MAFEWPPSPTLDQEVIGPGGQRYRWDGVKWVAIQEGRFAPQTNPASEAYQRANNYSPFDVDGGDY